MTPMQKELDQSGFDAVHSWMQAWLHHLELASPTRRHVWFDSRSEAGRCVLVDLYIFRDSLAEEFMSDPRQIHVLMILKRTHKYPPKKLPSISSLE